MTFPTRAQRRALARAAGNDRAPIYTGAFWADLSERVVTSAAGGALAVASATTFVIQEPTSWAALGVGAGAGALLSFLKGIAASRTGTGSPSIATNV
ncbi:holin [Microbacterium dauci]|uniref:Holin n=1 Tax=Microbacterium dauci TaxID=3048008 RepID=A0ABT6ZGT6_9MICO|nr:holin [Microbacterium sp. LX3-4]MDJ1115353.1 holin [Microbacterium sp. LX3-4]